MSQKHKRPSIGSWAAVGIALLLAYILSFAPACRLTDSDVIPLAWLKTLYRPCIDAALDGPKPVAVPLNWWVERFGGESILVVLLFDRLLDKGHLHIQFGPLMPEDLATDEDEPEN